MLSEGFVGPLMQAKGTTSRMTSDETGGVRVAQAHAPYEDAVLRGAVYAASTAAAGVAPGTAIGTTGAYALFNPKTSGVRVNLLALSMGYLSGTLGAGFVAMIAHNNPAQAVISGTAIVATSTRVGMGQSGAALPFTTATVPASGILLFPLWSLDASLATSVVGARSQFIEMGGLVTIEPGCAISLQGIAAGGTSPLVIFGAIWEEVPILGL